MPFVVIAIKTGKSKMIEEKEDTVVTVANVIQVTFDVIKEAEGNAFEFPEDRKGNDALILQDIKDAYSRYLGGVVA